MAAREADLLPVGTFHSVFKLSAEIAAIAFNSKALVYGLVMPCNISLVFLPPRSPELQSVENIKQYLRAN